MWQKPLLRLFGAALALVSFNAGYNYAQSSPATIEQINFAAQDGGTRMIIVTREDLKLHPFYDRASKIISIRMPEADALKAVFDVSYKDGLVESVKLERDQAGGGLRLILSFTTPDVAFHRVKVENSQNIALDFTPREKGVKIKGVTPEQFMARFTARPEEPKAETAAPMEPAPEQAVVAETASPAPEEPAPKTEMTPEDQARYEAMFASQDEKYTIMEQNSGRAEFIAIMYSLQKQKFEDVTAQADAFFAKYPKSVYLERVYFTKADALYMLAKKDKIKISEALEAFETALELYPQSPMSQMGMMRRASLYEDLEFNMEAMVELNMARKYKPDSKYAVHAMIGRAKILIRQKKYNKAYDELQKILLLYPNRREVRDVKYLIAEAYHDQGKYGLAKVVFDESMRLWPTYPKAHPTVFMKIAENFYKLGEKEKALEFFTNISNLFPSASVGRKAMLRMGDLYAEKSLKKDAAQIFETVAVRFPDTSESVLARLRLATMGAEDPELIKHSDIFDYRAFEDPLKTFDEIVARYAEVHGEEALIRKGKALALRKRYVASILAYKELLRNYPGTRMSEEVFGLVRGNFLKLIDTFHEQDGFFLVLLTYYDNFNPFLRSVTETETLIKIADSFGAMTLYDRSAEYYRLANASDPEGKYREVTDFRMAKARLFNGQVIESEKLLRKYMEDFPKSPNAITARHFLGHALLNQNKPAEAATEWRLAIEKDPRNQLVSNTAYQLGRLYRGQKQYSLAIDAFNMALASWRPLIKTMEDPAHVKDSLYYLAESLYRDGDYAMAIREANRFVGRYPDDGRNSWMEYIISASLSNVNEDEKANARLKSLAEKDKGLIGKVASAKLRNEDWKRKNPEVFPD
ncbi:MAG: tetratricopeptide repeat protein [Nitrospinae bacterium]|nr:tetratricopeptide repeat protein [Nitrospinota bacterium]